MKRVLVTGASGFIGRWAVDPLLARGYEVHALRHPADASPARSDVAYHEADFLEAGRAAEISAAVRATHLLHFAWYAKHGAFWTSPENVSWLAASAEWVRRFHEAGGRRAVFAGTCAEYDVDRGWCTEAAPVIRPATLYGVAKDSLRRLVEGYATSLGSSWAWGRIFLLHGPGEASTRLVPSVVSALVRGEPTRCSHGRQVRDFLHVRDVATAFAALLDSEVVGPVNVASGEPRTVRELVTVLAERAGRSDLARFGDVAAAPGDPPLLVGDIRRLRDEVGFTPSMTFNEALAATFDAIRKEQEGS